MRASRRARSLFLTMPLRTRDSAMSTRRCSRRIRRAPIGWLLLLALQAEKDQDSKACPQREGRAILETGLTPDAVSLVLSTSLSRFISPEEVRLAEEAGPVLDADKAGRGQLGLHAFGRQVVKPAAPCLVFEPMTVPKHTP